LNRAEGLWQSVVRAAKCQLIFKWTLREEPVRLSGGFGEGRKGIGEVPEEQFIDPADWVLGDAGQNLAEISLRVQTVEFCRVDQRIDGGSAFADESEPAKR